MNAEKSGKLTTAENGPSISVTITPYLLINPFLYVPLNTFTAAKPFEKFSARSYKACLAHSINT
ncbi:hypothetical protein ACFFH4_18370 [Halalkalibacter alkalisediminis]|uniref:Uncharacterized protein n=1 Tax=Halalkalibacter alkalisediminis TaxID=935616 RepID=A0ABV6NJQ4_9BACI